MAGLTVLIATATPGEIGPIVASLGSGLPLDTRICRYAHNGRTIDTLIAGVGMVSTAVWTTRALARRPYDLALNLGICGSFDAAIKPGQVVHIVSDRFAELGSEDGEGFLTLADLGLEGEDTIVNEKPPVNRVLDRLPAVQAITVNTVHGREPSIAAIVERLRPQVESMEGAAFMYACATAGIPFVQLRSVSNIVARRNRASWRIEEAIDTLGAVALDFLESL